jgi:hypothetical protein
MGALTVLLRDCCAGRRGPGEEGEGPAFQRPARMMYEASYTGKNGKQHEALVKADGTETKE